MGWFQRVFGRTDAARLERAQHLREQPRDLGLAQRVRPSQMGGEVARCPRSTP